MLLSHLPSLLIWGPILFAVISIIINRITITKLLILLFHIFIAYLLINYYSTFYKSLAHISYEFGGWKAPYGIEFTVNKINLFFIGLLYLVSFLTILFSWNDMDYLIFPGNQTKFLSVYLLCLAGFAGIILTNDIFNLYVFIEISSIASYALYSVSQNKFSIKSALDYLILGTLAATFFLFGIGFIYIATGTLNLSDISNTIRVHQDNQNLINFGYLFIVAGLFLKAALFPVHRWLVNLYKNSNYFIIIFFSAISTKIIIFIFIKLQNSIFSNLPFEVKNIKEVISGLAIAGIVVASISAIFQNNLRQVFAYSSISQISYIMVACIYFPTNYELLILMITAHSLAKMLLLMVSSYLNKQCNIINKAVLARKIPITLSGFICFILAAASIIGIPGTVGFIAKINLIINLFNHFHWLIILIIVSGSLLSLVYFWGYIEGLYRNLQANPQMVEDNTNLNIDLNQRIVLGAIALLIMLLGLYPNFLYKII